MPWPSKTPEHQGRLGRRWRLVASQSNLKGCVHLSSGGGASWLQYPIHHGSCVGDAPAALLGGAERQRMSPQRGRNGSDDCLKPAEEREEATGCRPRMIAGASLSGRYRRAATQRKNQGEYCAGRTRRDLGLAANGLLGPTHLAGCRIQSTLLCGRLTAPDGQESLSKGEDMENMERGPT